MFIAESSAQKESFAPYAAGETTADEFHVKVAKMLEEIQQLLEEAMSLYARKTSYHPLENAEEEAERIKLILEDKDIDVKILLGKERKAKLGCKGT